MTDLIERLRDISNDRSYCNGRMCQAEGALDEAADEIERNRKEIDGLLELLRKDRAEIERLREINYELQFGMGLRDKHIAKLRAVVRVAKFVRDYPGIREYIGTLLYYEFVEAIAALEQNDE